MKSIFNMVVRKHLGNLLNYNEYPDNSYFWDMIAEYFTHE